MPDERPPRHGHERLGNRLRDGPQPCGETAGKDGERDVGEGCHPADAASLRAVRSNHEPPSPVFGARPSKPQRLGKKDGWTSLKTRCRCGPEGRAPSDSASGQAVSHQQRTRTAPSPVGRVTPCAPWDRPTFPIHQVPGGGQRTARPTPKAERTSNPEHRCVPRSVRIQRQADRLNDGYLCDQLEPRGNVSVMHPGPWSLGGDLRAAASHSIPASSGPRQWWNRE